MSCRPGGRSLWLRPPGSVSLSEVGTDSRNGFSAQGWSIVSSSGKVK